MRFPVRTAMSAIALVVAAACAPTDGESAENARPMDVAPLNTSGPVVYIANLENGDTVSGPVRVIFGLSGYGVAPAGVTMDNTGHHHLLIDTVEVPAGAPLPAIPGEVVHFGGGQTETVLELAPGDHTLMLVLGDANHVPLTPSIQSDPITITVE